MIKWVCQILKTRHKILIQNKIYKNAVLLMMLELIGGCSHLISPYGVLYGCVAVLSVDVY
jgi:hypothetical protein